MNSAEGCGAPQGAGAHALCRETGSSALFSLEKRRSRGDLTAALQCL